MKYLIALTLLTLLPFQLYAGEWASGAAGNIRVEGRVRLRADIDQPFSAEAQIPGPAATDPAPTPVQVQPAPVYQYTEPAPVYQHDYLVPQYQARLRYRLRVQPARFYFQPYVAYEPAFPAAFADPCLAGFGGGFLGRRERLDIRYRYRSGW